MSGSRRKTSKRRHGEAASKKVGRALHQAKRGKLRSGRSKKKVRSRKQAIAIGLSQGAQAGRQGAAPQGSPRTIRRASSCRWSRSPADERRASWCGSSPALPSVTSSQRPRWSFCAGCALNVLNRRCAAKFVQEGEAIVTEHCYKYEPEAFGRLVGEAGFEVERVWLDPQRRFSVHLLRSV